MKNIIILAFVLLLFCIIVCVDIPKPVKGDVNCDRRVTITDLVILHRHVELGDKMKCPGNADMNRDGVIDVLDLVKLQRHLAGLE
ncbi:MAG: hypothetical protein CVU90_15140 [Firmicutes bacterium HGW-Firmicutes-15]|jgi:hypothetical protein|nr:MAG: hypothetical protein CVU90_15140 [Firmicutes bacterium HGW-Firmicutes-15]